MSARPGRSWTGTSAPRPRADAPRARASAWPPGGVSGQPQRGGRVARAAAHAGGDRDALGDAQRAGAARPSRSPRGRRRSAAAARFGPSTPGQLDRRRRRLRGAGSSHSSSASERGCTRDTSACRPSSRGAAEVEAEVDLAGGERGQRHAASCSARAAKSAGASRSARASGGKPSVDQRGAGALPDAGRARRARARATRPAPCAGGRRRRGRASRTAGGAARAVAVEADEHRVDVRDREEDGARDRAGDADVAGQLGEHRGQAVGRRRRARRRAARRPRAGPWPPSGVTLGSSSIVRRIDARGDPVRQVGHDLRRRGVERVEVERHARRRGGASCSRGRRERVLERGLERAVDLDDVDVGDRCGEVLGEHAEPAADLEHDVGRVELGRARR